MNATMTRSATRHLTAVPTDAPTALRVEPAGEAGMWRVGYDGSMPGMPWFMVHVPSGWRGEWPELRNLNRWLATRPLNVRVSEMRSTSKTALRRQDTPAADRHRAATVLAVLDDVMLPHGTAQAPERKCVCGGYIVQAASGEWRHVNACRYCYTPGGWATEPAESGFREGLDGRHRWVDAWAAVQHPEWAGVCPDDYAQHTMCWTPSPVDCGVGLCSRESGLDGYCTTHGG